MTTYQVPVYDDYIFLIDNNGLLYWGFLAELNKADDELIISLAPIISSRVEQYYEQQQAH
jgi:hypothetical protein